MKAKTGGLPLLPALVVAIYCLLRDEGLVSFLKKVVVTYAFFSLLASVFAWLWGVATREEEQTD